MRRRAFTLIELLVVLLIVTALSALVIPTLVGRVAGSRLDGAVRAIEFGASLASGEAMRRGEVVSLVAVRVTPVERDPEWVLFAQPVDGEGAIEALGERAAAFEDVGAVGDQSFGLVEESEAARVELTSFAGVELLDEPDLGALAPDPFGTEVPTFEQAEMMGESPMGEELRMTERVLGLFFPDGSVRVGDRVYLLAMHSAEQVSVTLLPLAGGVDARPVTEASLADREDELLGAEDDELLPPPTDAAPDLPGEMPIGGSP